MILMTLLALFRFLMALVQPDLFFEDFNGTSLDSSKWRLSPNKYGWEGNCQGMENVSVSGGALHLRASNLPNPCNAPYSGATIQTDVKKRGFQFTYGYVESRVKVPSGVGLWPGVWLYSTKDNREELDIGEWLGGEVNTVHTTVHFRDGSTAGGAPTGTPWADRQWHVIGMDWQPGRVTWYADGQQIQQVIDSRVPSTPQFILLDMFIGGWAGHPDASTPFPSFFDVDYVRVRRTK